MSIRRKVAVLATSIPLVLVSLVVPTSADAESGLRIATWLSATTGGQYGSVPEYYLRPFLIGNPTKSTVRFDRIEFVFQFEQPRRDEVTAQTIVLTKGEFPTGGRISYQHFGGDRPGPPKDKVLEPLTLRPNVDLGIGGITLMPRVTREAGSPTRLVVTLYLGSAPVLRGASVDLPPWKELPRTEDLYWMGKEKKSGVRGQYLDIPLSIPARK